MRFNNRIPLCAVCVFVFVTKTTYVQPWIRALHSNYIDAAFNNTVSTFGLGNWPWCVLITTAYRWTRGPSWFAWHESQHPLCADLVMRTAT